MNNGDPFVYNLHIRSENNINVALCGYVYGTPPCGWKKGELAVVQAVKPCIYVHVMLYRETDHSFCEECLAHEDYPLLVLGEL